MHLGALERRVGDEVSIPRGPQKRWADLDDKERAEREAQQAQHLKSRYAKRKALPLPFVWAPSPEHDSGRGSGKRTGDEPAAKKATKSITVVTAPERK